MEISKLQVGSSVDRWRRGGSAVEVCVLGARRLLFDTLWHGGTLARLRNFDRNRRDHTALIHTALILGTEILVIATSSGSLRPLPLISECLRSRNLAVYRLRSPDDHRRRWTAGHSLPVTTPAVSAEAADDRRAVSCPSRAGRCVIPI